MGRAKKGFADATQRLAGDVEATGIDEERPAITIQAGTKARQRV